MKPLNVPRDTQPKQSEEGGNSSKTETAEKGSEAPIPTTPDNKSAATAKPRLPDVPVPKLSGESTPSSTAPQVIAKKADEAVAKLEHVSAETDIIMKGPEGRGTARPQIRITDGSRFQVQYADFTISRPSTGAFEADGKTLFELPAEIPKGNQGSWIKLGPARGSVALPVKDLAEDLPGKFSKIAFGALTHKTPTFSEIVAQVEKDSRYTMKVDHQKALVGNQVVEDNRITITRGDSYKVEMVFDSQLGLPVTMRASKGVGKNLEEVYWAANYEHGPKFGSFKTHFMVTPPSVKVPGAKG
ncbi:MAG: hypothetical protein JSS72_03505 [Armatimonadetes bacterium]|nr:hypothetical protein [Armatimonadota bacterium]